MIPVKDSSNTTRTYTNDRNAQSIGFVNRAKLFYSFPAFRAFVGLFMSWRAMPVVVNVYAFRKVGSIDTVENYWI